MIIDIVKLAAKIYFDSNHSNRQNHNKIDFDYDLNYTKKRKILSVSLQQSKKIIRASQYKLHHKY